MVSSTTQQARLADSFVFPATASFFRRWVVTVLQAPVDVVAKGGCIGDGHWRCREAVAAPRRLSCFLLSSSRCPRRLLLQLLSKHIDIKYHKIRALIIAEKQINIEYCSSECQLPDIFTKPLKMETFLKLKKNIGMTNISNLV
nr:hypothetical protein Ahy_A02g008146 isoform B [Ipomoea trifida]